MEDQEKEFATASTSTSGGGTGQVAAITNFQFGQGLIDELIRSPLFFTSTTNTNDSLTKRNQIIDKYIGSVVWSSQYCQKRRQRKMRAASRLGELIGHRERSRTHSENTDRPCFENWLKSASLVSSAGGGAAAAVWMDTMDTIDVSNANNHINPLPGTSALVAVKHGRCRDNGTTRMIRLARTSISHALPKKSKSLEDIRTENIDGSQPSHEMEFVSSFIQKLKLQE